MEIFQCEYIYILFNFMTENASKAVNFGLYTEVWSVLVDDCCMHYCNLQTSCTIFLYTTFYAVLILITFYVLLLFKTLVATILINNFCMDYHTQYH